MFYLRSFVRSSPLYPVLALEAWFSGKTRHTAISVTQVLVIFSGLLLVFFLVADKFYGTGGSTLISILQPKLSGLLFLSLGLFILAKLLDTYFTASYYFDNIISNDYRPSDLFTFTVGRVLYQAGSEDDLLKAFLFSTIGRLIMKRLGVNELETEKVIVQRKDKIVAKIPLASDGVLTLEKLVTLLYEENKDFAELLFRHGLQKVDLLGAVAWTVKEVEMTEYEKRWWRPEKLARVPGIARDWSFGRTFTLDKYSTDLLLGLETNQMTLNFSARQAEIDQIEDVLSREREDNIILIGESTDETIDVVYHLVERIQAGRVVQAVAGKRPLLFNSALFLAAFKDKNSLEAEFVDCLNEAAKVGNVILVIDNLATLLAGAQNLEANLLGLMEPYLSSNRIQLIALVGNDAFHHYLEPNRDLMNRFERVFIKPLPPAMILENLEEAVWHIESKYGLFFTYPALLEIITDAENYFEESVSSDKALDLLTEIAPWLVSQNLKLVTKAEVQSFVSRKTNIPLGEVSSEEKEKLLDLESLLHARIIGQTEAVKLVANALRRARAGVRNPNRPIGSFLFLGPTGVGKTETAKALAAVFFGSENALMRLDMSEYQTDDSLARLIGSFQNEKPGVLANLVKEHPYGVLLLDEFEKTNKEVLNLFLQILDEGFFSDAWGKRINVRNLMFVATSNAGADLIWEMVEKGVSLEGQNNVIIDHLVKEAIFKPELLNRFDAVVTFHPLSETELAAVAKLQLKKLAKRLEAQGVRLEIDDNLCAKVATLGANKVFGARPMQRFIQDEIEQQVADKLIKGEITHGSIVRFAPEASDGEALPLLVVQEV